MIFIWKKKCVSYKAFTKKVLDIYFFLFLNNTQLIKLQCISEPCILPRVFDHKSSVNQVFIMSITKVCRLNSGKNKRKKEELENNWKPYLCYNNCIFNMEWVIIILPNLPCFCRSNGNYLRKGNIIVHSDFLIISSIPFSFYDFEKSRKICYLYWIITSRDLNI